jgi:PAS domain S-box-containing protein
MCVFPPRARTTGAVAKVKSLASHVQVTDQSFVQLLIVIAFDAVTDHLYAGTSVGHRGVVGERVMNQLQLDGFAKSLSLAVGCWRADGTFFDTNDGLANLLGCPSDDINTGRVRWQDITPPEYASLDEQAMDEIRKFGRCAPFEKEYICADGRRVPVLISAATFDDAQDAGSFCIIDLRQRKHLTGTSQADAQDVLRLTARQRLIALLCSHGIPQKRIADLLDIGLRTVEMEKQRTAATLGLQTRSAALWAVSHQRRLTDSLSDTGLIAPDIERLITG